MHKVTRTLLRHQAAFHSAYPVQPAKYLSDRYMFQIQVEQKKMNNVYTKQTFLLVSRITKVLKQMSKHAGISYATSRTVLRLSRRS
jgi:hypothetical protein